MIIWCCALLVALSAADDIELPEVVCLGDVMTVTFINTAKSMLSKGRVYVVGHEESERCTQRFKSMEKLHVEIPLLHCADIQPLNNDNNSLVKVNVYIRVSPHPVLITGDSKEFHLECTGLEKTSLYGPNNTTSVNTVCQHNVKTSGKEKRLEEIIFHEWTCSEQYGIEDFIMWIREITVISKRKQEVMVITNNGCAKDEAIISNLHPSLTGVQKITALSQFFKFPIENSFRIKTSIVLVPRIINNQVVPYLDCSAANLGYYIDFVEAVKTTTLTDWITVETDEDILEQDSYVSCPRLLINQELEPFEKTINSTDSILDLLDKDLFNNSESLIKVNQKDLRIDDIILNQLNQSITMIMLKNQSRYDITFPMHRKAQCSWQSLNTFLLLWSIISVLIWMVQLSFKFYMYLVREFDDPLSQVPESPTPSKSWAEPYRLNQKIIPKSSEYLEFERHHFF